MTKVAVAVAADASEYVVAASAQKKTGTNDEEKGNHESKAEDSCGEGPNRWATIPTRKNNVLLWLLLCIMLVFIVVGLSVGLTRRSQYQQKESSATVSSDNLSIFDEALALLESTPLRQKMSVAKPSRTENTTWISRTLWSFFQASCVLGVAQTMVMGFSTGGGIAFYMAQRHPEKIKAAFLTHSIPISGLRYVTVTGELVPLKDLDQVRASTMFPTDDPDMVYDLFKSMSSNQEGFVPKNHKLAEYMIKAAQNMPGKTDVAVVNAKFNVTPIKTSLSPSSNVMSTLKSRVVVIHGSEDFIVPWQIVEPVTKLAIIEQWAPLGMLSLYDDASGHTSLIDKPRALASVYRRALEEQILSVPEEKI
eukprot:scaffold2761_cov137-Skeletonema_menzelii.AAC.2